MDNFLPETPPFVSKQAVSKERQGISHKAFLELFRFSVEQFYFQSANLHTWTSFHIYAVDGSKIQIPESAENYMVFGGNPNKTEKVSPLASESVLYDVMNDILVDVSPHSYRYNERKSAQAHMNFLPGFPHSIIVFDRVYPFSDNQKSFTLRSIHLLLEDGSAEYLVTNLMPEQMASKKFSELYRLRWGVESKYRELKNISR